MVTIAFFETDEGEEKYFKEHFSNDDVSFSPHSLDIDHEYDQKLFQAEIVCVFVDSQVKKEVLEKFPNLKCIVTRSTGYDHIDLEYCKSKNIVVSNVPSYGVHSVAEQTFALILALSRRIVPSVEKTRKGDFSREGLIGFELFEKTLGVVGVGNIGSVVAKLGLGMGMKVLAYNRHEDEELKKLGVQFADLDTVLSRADVVTLHLPYTKETEHTINMNNISKIKKGALLINAARGALVETQAILEGLNQGILQGVGLDVLEEEYNMREERELPPAKVLQSPDVKTQLMDHMLLDKDNVIVTPHNAANTNESLHQILETTVKDIQGFTSNAAINVVTK